MTWERKNGIAKLATPTSQQIDLFLTAGYEPTSVLVPRLDPNKGSWTLGAYISPSGSMVPAKEQLGKIAKEYATAITGSTLTRNAAIWSYVLYYIPKFAYSAPVLTLTEEECVTLQSPALLALLPKLHMNRHTACSIIFGPTLYGGLALPSLYGQQCYGQLRFFLGHVRLEDTTGRLILINLSYLQLLSSTTNPSCTNRPVYISSG
jgi:hypothetical protein